MTHIVDDDAMVRESAALLLRAAGYGVTTYSSGTDFLERLDATTPGCILLDIHMPKMDGLEVQRRLAARGVDFPVIVFTGQGDVAIAVQAMKNGAFEFLEKPYLNRILLDSVHEAFERIEAAAEDQARDVQVREQIGRLTPREMQILRALLAGLPNKVTAFELNISPRTVEVYRANVMRKLRVRSLSQAVRIALAAGVEPYVSSHDS